MSVAADEIVGRTASELASDVAGGEVSAAAGAQADLEQIEATAGDLHAFLFVDTDGALAAAAEADKARAAGQSLGPLAGVPLAMKDVFAMRGALTTAGAKILQGSRPPYDATVVSRLRAAGVVILGKTRMDEFAMGSSTANS